MEVIIIITSLVGAILCIILYFKILGMCDDVRLLKNYFIKMAQSQQMLNNTTAKVNSENTKDDCRVGQKASSQ